jgi:hypothetical protein
MFYNFSGIYQNRTQGKSLSSNAYPYYNNVNSVSNVGGNIDNFPSKFNSNSNIPTYSVNNGKVNIYQQNNVNYYNTVQQFYPQNGSSKPQYSINNNQNSINSINNIYPNNTQGMYYSTGPQQQPSVPLNGKKQQVPNGYYNQGFEYGNYNGNNGVNQFYVKNELPKGNIGQFYPNIGNNLASI